MWTGCAQPPLPLMRRQISVVPALHVASIRGFSAAGGGGPGSNGCAPAPLKQLPFAALTAFKPPIVSGARLGTRDRRFCIGYVINRKVRTQCLAGSKTAPVVY